MSVASGIMLFVGPIVLLLVVVVVVMVIKKYEKFIETDYTGYYVNKFVPTFEQQCLIEKLQNNGRITGYPGSRCIWNCQCQPGLRCVYSKPGTSYSLRAAKCSGLIPTSGICAP